MTPVEVIDLSASACLALGAVTKAVADERVHLPHLPSAVRTAPAAVAACVSGVAMAAVDAATLRVHEFLLHHDQMKAARR
ncbi:hypothetical protein [Streptomyces uncialis]|uniref:hypothetical protein n=1 Tax=Streptomyces uncialis TaxID=1048205 RepID=UPI0033E87747